MDKNESVYRASVLLVRHFRDCLERGRRGQHSRVFSHILRPEIEFVGCGRSQAVIDGEPQHPEHVVPCAVMIEESFRLLESGSYGEHEIAGLLSKHWKVALISKREAAQLDAKDGDDLKSQMPRGWTFEEGDTFARLTKAGIRLEPLA